jgi:hypothetical protein
MKWNKGLLIHILYVYIYKILLEHLSIWLITPQQTLSDLISSHLILSCFLSSPPVYPILPYPILDILSFLILPHLFYTNTVSFLILILSCPTLST